jgi:hypothetical protein
MADKYEVKRSNLHNVREQVQDIANDLDERVTNTDESIDTHIADDSIHGKYYEQITEPLGAVDGSFWYDPSENVVNGLDNVINGSDNVVSI